MGTGSRREVTGALLMMSVVSVAGCGPRYSGPIAIGSEGGRPVVHARVCSGSLNDVMVYRDDDLTPLVWHREKPVKSDLRVDLGAPADGWQGPALTVVPSTRYRVSLGRHVTFGADGSIGSGVWSGGIAVTGADLADLPPGQVIIAPSRDTRASSQPGVPVPNRRTSLAEYRRTACRGG